MKDPIANVSAVCKRAIESAPKECTPGALKKVQGACAKDFKSDPNLVGLAAAKDCKSAMAAFRDAFMKANPQLAQAAKGGN